MSSVSPAKICGLKAGIKGYSFHGLDLVSEKLSSVVKALHSLRILASRRDATIQLQGD